MSSQEPQAASGSRAAGCASLLLVVVAVPIAAIGFLVYVSAEDAGAANSGTAGGLAGLGSVAGIALIVVAACVFAIGAVAYVRSGSESS